MNIDERLTKIENSLSKIDLILEALISKKAESPKIEEPAPAVMGKVGEWVPYGASILKETPIIKPFVEPKVVETPIVEPKVVETPIVEPKVVEKPKVEIPIDLLNLINSKEWPAAVDPALICDITSEQDKEDRAEGILDLIIDTHLENLKFLDFGCGEGHVTNKSKIQNPKMSVGYDIVKSEKWEKWEKTPNSLLTDNWSLVKSSGPYNIVLMYDVIDHMIGPVESIIEKLKAIKALLAPNGKIFMRAHPWCSRHATHLYHKLNKAYIHLVLTEEELTSLGYEQQKVRRIIHPVAEYENFFTKAGLKIISKQQIKENVEPFYTKHAVVAQRIKKNYIQSSDTNLRSGTTFPTLQLEQQFIDYTLG